MLRLVLVHNANVYMSLKSKNIKLINRNIFELKQKFTIHLYKFSTCMNLTKLVSYDIFKRIVYFLSERKFSISDLISMKKESYSLVASNASTKNLLVPKTSSFSSISLHSE
jgi:hypothetical protein